MNTGIKSSTRFKVLQRDNFKCAYCGIMAEESALEVDHIFPRSEGGSNHIDNLITACSPCNQGKSDLVMGNDILERMINLAKERNEKEQAKKPRPIEVTIRGQWFPSMKDAALKLGIPPKSVWAAKEKGQKALDRLGLNKGGNDIYPHPNSKRYVVDGITYHGVRDYADKNDVSLSKAQQCCSKGTSEAAHHCQKVKVKIDGIEYQSIAQASKAVGLGVGTIRSRIKKYGHSFPLKIERPKKKEKDFPVTIRGTYYPTAREAAQALGVKRQRILDGIRFGTLQTCGLGKGQHKQQEGHNNGSS